MPNHKQETKRKQGPKVVIVGAGFGGLSAARALKGLKGSVVIIDRNNHHLFQPLLYQVATTVLSATQIAAPVRGILAGHSNTTVVQGEVTGVNAAEKRIYVDDADRKNVPVPYDFLILATGVHPNYLGHNDFRAFAPPLKSVADAEEVRNRILGAFELAEAEEDPAKHQDLLTFVLVGAGPTGVEMAAALATLVRTTLKRQFRRIDPSRARVCLIDSGHRPLATFAPELSAKTAKRLAKLGVETISGEKVTRVTEEGLQVGSQWIPCKTVVWTAGVTPSPAAQWLDVASDHAGRVRILPDLTAPAMPNVFVIGDTASLDQDGKPLPGVAQVALQQGKYAAQVILAREAGKPAPSPFHYHDKGNLAVVGPGFAVLDTKMLKTAGLLAWCVWAGVHISFLAQASLRVGVLLQWLWTLLSRQSGSRLIVKPNTPSAQ